jgi:Cys-tRNA(Pro)/Cys-tRNA(Cys) deacylase
LELVELSTLESFLRAKKLWYSFVEKSETVHTADAASVTGIALAKITKNLVSLTESGEYVLLVVSGDRRVDLKKAAAALGVRNVRTVPFEKAESISGYPPGGTPTIGHKTKMSGNMEDSERCITRTVLDRSLLDLETIFCGGGSRDRLLELKVKEILDKGENILVADIAE